MREMYHELYEVKKQRKLPIKWMAPEAIYEQIFTSKSDVYVLFLTYDTAEYNTDFKCTRNLKIPLIWVCVAAWGFLCVYGIYKHYFGVLRILSPVMVIFQNVTKHFSHCKICQDQNRYVFIRFHSLYTKFKRNKTIVIKWRPWFVLNHIQQQYSLILRYQPPLKLPFFHIWGFNIFK